MKVLDTNAYTALFRGHEAIVAPVRRAEQVLVSVVVAGELLFGFRNGSCRSATPRSPDDVRAAAQDLAGAAGEDRQAVTAAS